MDQLAYVNKNIIAGDRIIYSVNRAGSGFVSEGFRIERNAAYPYCVLHYVSKGSGVLNSRGKKYHVKSGQLFVLNAYEAHMYMTDPKDILSLNWIEFYGGDSIRLIDAFLSRCSLVLDAPGSRNVNDLIYGIITCLKNGGEEDPYLISQKVYTMLLCLLKSANVGISAAQTVHGASSIQRALDYIDLHLHENLSIQCLSSISNFNATYFSKLFREQIGLTPARYIMNRRVNKAREELAEKGTPVELLAEKLGFCNASHFIRLFKKSTGLTPSAYRREYLLYRQKI
jgi:AraC-like DNA-binding protein